MLPPNLSRHAPDPNLATREIVVTAELVIRDFRDPEPTQQEIAEYLGISVETETGESDWWLTDTKVLGFSVRQAEPVAQTA